MKRHIQPAGYIMASECRGTTYIGVTSNLAQRVWQHRNHVVEGFSERYHVTMLVWYELHLTMESAIGREKALKMWKRAWKFRLIETENSAWRDLGLTSLAMTARPWSIKIKMDSCLRRNDEAL